MIFDTEDEGRGNMIGNVQLAFIGYFLLPFIAVGIDMRRSGKEMKFSFAAFLLYVSYATALVMVVYAVRFILSRLGVGMTTDPGTDIYIFIACVIALILPYIKEIIVTYCNVRCEIKGKNLQKDKGSDEK